MTNLLHQWDSEIVSDFPELLLSLVEKISMGLENISGNSWE